MPSVPAPTQPRVRPSLARSAANVLGAWALVCPESLFAQDACEVDRVTAADAGTFDSFGYSVAICEDVQVSGAVFNDDNGLDSGSAYIFRFNGATWVQEQKLLASDDQADDAFGISVAVDGGTTLIGAANHAHLGSPAAGAVYAFNYNGTSWAQHQELRASDGQSGDGFGWSVSIRGNLAIVGARTDPPGGSAYVFRYDPQTLTWVEEQKLLPLVDDLGFGHSVSIDGDLAVVGAQLADLFVRGDIGAAYVFRFDGTRWSLEQKLKPFDAPGMIAFFGESVSMHGDAVLVGATAGSGADQGSAYVFRYDLLQPLGFRWVGEQVLLPAYSKLGMQFGKSVALHGDTALIGAWLSDLTGLDYGSAHVFRHAKDSGWIEQQTLLPQPGPWTAFYGFSVALSGDVATVGAYGENFQSGAAYLYAGMSGVDCNTNGAPDACDLLLQPALDANGDGVLDKCACMWDLDGSGDVAVNDFLALLAQWGTDPGGPPDFDGDGTVGIFDFLDLLSHWGPCT